MDKKGIEFEAPAWLIYALVVLIVIIALLYIFYNAGEDLWTKISSFF